MIMIITLLLKKGKNEAKKKLETFTVLSTNRFMIITPSSINFFPSPQTDAKKTKTMNIKSLIQIFKEEFTQASSRIKRKTKTNKNKSGNEARRNG